MKQQLIIMATHLLIIFTACSSVIPEGSAGQDSAGPTVQTTTQPTPKSSEIPPTSSEMEHISEPINPTETAVLTDGSQTPTVSSGESGDGLNSDFDPAAIHSGETILVMRDNDLWRGDINWESEQRLTTGGMLSGWFQTDAGGELWWAGGFAPQVHVSPDGRFLAFTQNGRNLVLVDVTNQEPPRIHEFRGWATIFTWAPDSQKLAYSTNSGIFMYDLLSDTIQQLSKKEGWNLVWSPDGRSLAFSCCFNEELPGPFDGTYSGQIHLIDGETQEEEAVGETWIGIASGSPTLCWSEAGEVGVDIVDPLICSFERVQPSGTSADGRKTAVLSLRSPDDEEYFRLLVLMDEIDDGVLWEQEVPLVQTVYWSPDGKSLLLGNAHYDIEASSVWRIASDGLWEAELLLPDALLLDVVAQWVND